LALKIITIKPGREKSLKRRHPWIFSGAIEPVNKKLATGETVEVRSATGDFLAYAAYSPQSKISLRVWSWDENDAIDADFFRARICKALHLRNLIGDGENRSCACRLIHAESDGIPGLVVDRYSNYLVVQFLAAGAEAQRELLVDLLVETTGIKNVYERSDVEVRRLEGLPERVGVLCGEPPPERLRIEENGLSFWVDIQRGHKTGFYLDQKDNRALLQKFTKGCRLLNCFCYTGAFTVYALAGGAESVLSVDSSADVITLAKEQVRLNHLPEDKCQWLEGDVFHVLRAFRDQGKFFDLIVLDPPKFAPTAAQAERAARGYKDINLLAFKLLTPGGLLFTFSCSGGIQRDTFQKIVAGAALDAGVDAQIIHYMAQGADHPTALNFPEGAYLKGLVCRVAG